MPKDNQELKLEHHWAFLLSRLCFDATLYLLSSSFCCDNKPIEPIESIAFSSWLLSAVDAPAACSTLSPHGSDWERAFFQWPKNFHNVLVALPQMS